MAQSWTLLSTQLIEDSDPIINANFETLQTSWAGTTYPTAPQGGQTFFHSTGKGFHVFNGTSWRQIFDTTQQWGGLLPRGHSVDYPMTADLHMGLFQIKNMLAGTADNDAVTVKQVRDDFIDAHYHSGDDNDGPRVKWDELDGHNASSDSLVQIAYGGSSLSQRRWALGEQWTGVACGGSMTEVVSTTCAVNADELKLIRASFVITSSNPGAIDLELTYAIGAGSQTQIIQRSLTKGTNFPLGITLSATQRLTQAATYTLRLNGRSVSGAHACSYNSIMVL